jgi:DNA-binding MarR family transcriptional regulator
VPDYDPSGREMALTLARAWNRVERRLDGALSSARGISFADYRLLQTLAVAPRSRASRVDLARAVGMSPSGVTRALRPLEKLGMVTTTKSDRDARLALAELTSAGHEVVSDGSAVVDQLMEAIVQRAPSVASDRAAVARLLEELGGE